jgi:hypothetical protein
MALALTGRFEPFSQGRGFITQKRVEEMETIAARHGIYLAPLYNADGPVGDGLDCQTEWSRACLDGLMERAEMPFVKTAKTEGMARIEVS